MHKRINIFFDKCKCLFKKQFGFRSSHSTNHALLNITERIKALVDTGQYVCSIFIDLEKAFDTVNHETLCHFNLASDLMLSRSIFRCYIKFQKLNTVVN